MARLWISVAVLDRESLPGEGHEYDGRLEVRVPAGRRHPLEIYGLDLVDGQLGHLVGRCCINRLAALGPLAGLDSRAVRLIALSEAIRLVARLDDMTMVC